MAGEKYTKVISHIAGVYLYYYLSDGTVYALVCVYVDVIHLIHP